MFEFSHLSFGWGGVGGSCWKLWGVFISYSSGLETWVLSCVFEFPYLSFMCVCVCVSVCVCVWGGGGGGVRPYWKLWDFSFLKYSRLRKPWGI